MQVFTVPDRQMLRTVCLAQTALDTVARRAVDLDQIVIIIVYVRHRSLSELLDIVIDGEIIGDHDLHGTSGGAVAAGASARNPVSLSF